jgi:S-DNA-T family DNA segregation ATPase FtsK/SpoIIIE
VATSDRKTTGKQNTAGRTGSSGTRTSSRKKQPAKKPIRREVGGLVMLVLALCVVVSYFGISALLIDGLAAGLKGLFGYGYWLTGAAFLLAGIILLFHHGRPVLLRVTSTLLLPVLFGALCHMVLCSEVYKSSIGILKTLWTSGIKLQSGGAVSGVLAVGSIAVFSKIASIILFTAFLVVLLMISFHLTLSALIEKSRNRPKYEEEPEKPREPAIRVTQTDRPKRGQDESRQKSEIDIPLDDAPLEKPASVKAEEKPAEKKGLLTGFFRQRSERQQTPDQLLNDTAVTAAPIAATVPASVPEPPVVLPTPEPAAPVEPVAAAIPAPTTGAKKNAAAVAAAAAAVTAEIEQTKKEEGAYQYPPITLLNENPGGNYAEAGAELRSNSRRLSETLTSFGVDAKPGEVIHGPTVTRYEFTLDQGVKLSKITNLADDIALALGASGVRIAPIPDKISVVGIEVPNKQVTPVLIRDVLESRAFADSRSSVAFALGKDIGGDAIIGNIAKLPHVLIAGTTGSGKSVCTNSLIVSLLYKSSPEDVRFIMVDPKMVELAPYNGIPHLLIPVVTDPKKAAGALQWAVFEMMKRYKLFAEHNVKDLKGYNALAKTSEELEHMPAVVVVIDELADLMLAAAKEVEESICRVAQMGRAAGVHLVIATQRPSADVITGLMKANIPSRIAFAVASSLESRIILDTAGAEKLVGKGDMLYAPLGMGKPLRVQGCFIAPEEIERVVEFVKTTGEAHYSDEVMEKIEESVREKEKGSKAAIDAAPADDCDEMLPAAVEVLLETGQASVSMLQRRLKLGYSRAARLVDQMEERGIVGPFEGSKPRQLLITKEQWQEMQMNGTAGAAPKEPTPDDDESAETEE